jgi:NADPH:quinone reductase-like Zn-dependent oxidoreductase
MKAITQDRYGSPDVLEFREVDAPVAAANEVLVRVHAASVNALDWHVMRGDPYLFRLSGGLRKPKHTILGKDFAGTVEAVGRNVTGFRPGDEVYGELPMDSTSGAFAEYLCVSDDQVELKPASLSFEEAAAVPVAASTALVGLRDVVQLRPGQRILINGASGGVGTFAVQLAKSFDAQVTAVCRTRNVDLVKSLGADHVIDYTREDFTRNGQRYDVVFDLVGNHSLTGFRRALTPRGTLVLSGGGVSTGGRLIGPMWLMFKGKLTAPFVRQRIRLLIWNPSRKHLAALRELIEAKKLSPVIDRTYSLNETPEAIRYLETEHARAKVVITV